MIKSITSTSPHITVHGGYPGPMYMNSSPNAQGVGNVRYNVANQRMEVYDGASWLMLPINDVNISLSAEIIETLEWARSKRAQEKQLEELAKVNTTVKDLVNQLNEKQEQVRMVQILLEKERNGSTTSSA
jgi:hypothetical protein